MIRRFLLTFFVTFGFFSVAISIVGNSNRPGVGYTEVADTRLYHSTKRCGAHWDFVDGRYQYHYIKC